MKLRSNDIAGMYNDLRVIYRTDAALLKAADEKEFVFRHQLRNGIRLILKKAQRAFQHKTYLKLMIFVQIRNDFSLINVKTSELTEPGQGKRIAVQSFRQR